MRDRTVGDTFYVLFTTRAFATGIPTVLSGTPVVSAYKDNSVTQITAGITLGVSHDGVVGLNLLTIVATGGNGFETGKDYSLVITTGTVGGVSVVGEVVGEFSLDLSAALKAVDLLNDVAATDIVTAGAITTSSGAVSNVTLAATTTALTNVINASSVVASVSGSVDSVTGDTKQTADHTAGIADIPTVSEFNARTLVAASYFDPAADAVANVTLVATTTTNTDMRGTDGVDTATMRGTDGANTVVPDAAGTAPTLAEMQTTALTESYAANGAAPTQNQLLYAVHQMLMEFAISGTAYTVKKLDNSTAFVVTLDDATNPTATSRD